MLNQKDFLEEYNISDETFDRSKLNWANLENIYTSYEKQRKDLLVTGNMIVDHLQQIKEVHSLKIRVKESKHLIEKIIRKKVKNPEREITLENYQSEITDLIGIRGLHLFKDDWVLIHKAICNKWELHEKPTANIRRGDAEKIFTDNDCELHEHEFGYRSVHYLVKCRPTKNLFIAEIQIRTIFEEGWSEIDHQLRYPYDTDNILLSGYLNVFNRLAGFADEMGTYIKSLKTEIGKIQNELLNKDHELEEKITELENIKETVEMKDAEKDKLQGVIDSLRSSNSSYSKGISIGSAIGSSQKCEKCGKDIPFSYIGSNKCSSCSIDYTGLASKGISIGSAMGSSQKCEKCGKDIPFSYIGSNKCSSCSIDYTLGSSFNLTYSSSQKCENCGTDIPFSAFGSKRCGVCSL